ncbi:hypothetical protein DFH94DRAFT_855288 [Russula ochroleuca]|uniref:Uncharacterized protein n=1 Tax=Russula ochroleuca TaxID=152965 RepID=A0A9P5MRR9_9AGAM|nr:hypothetical protein DFH94DRAFT_855288 [Russula ochroleuca]
MAVAYAGVLYGTPRLLYLVKSLVHVSNAAQGAVRRPKNRFHHWYLSSMKFKKAQELAPLLDGEVLKRTLDMLGSDDVMEQFFEAVLIVCMRVIEVADLSVAVPQILHLFSGDLREVSRSVEIGHSLGILRHCNAASLARGIISGMVYVSTHRSVSLWYRNDHICQGLESPSFASTNALSLSDPEAATIASPNITGRTATFGSVTLKANDNARDLDSTIQTA